MAFRRGYYSKAFSKQYIKRTGLEIFISSLLPGVVIQIFYAWFVHYILRYNIDFASVVKITSSETEVFQKGTNALINDFSQVSMYFGSQIVLSWFTGYLGRFLIRKFKVDIKTKLFRYRNKWHYILEGEMVNFPENNLNKNQQFEHVDTTWVDALIELDGKTVIYSGMVADYHLALKENNLEHIEIVSVIYREKASGIKKVVNSDTMVIPYSNVVNLNFTYLEDDKKKLQRKEKEKRRKKLNFRLRETWNYIIIGIIVVSFWMFYIDIGFEFKLYRDYVEKNIIIKFLTMIIYIRTLSLLLFIGRKEKIEIRKFNFDNEKARKFYRKNFMCLYWVFRILLIIVLFILLYQLFVRF